MTREEAIGLIKDHIDTYVVCHGEEDTVAVSIDNVDVEALTMAIKALEQEPSGDLISKKSAKNAIYKVCLSEGNKDIFVKILDEINKLPSIEQEPSVEIVNTEESNDNGTKYLNINVSDNEVKRNPNIVRLCSDVGMLEYAKPSGDAISRQAVLDLFKTFWRCFASHADEEIFKKEIAELPPIKQEPKTGHWIKYGELYQCSECKELSYCQGKFCNECGARMVEPQEESEG